jgi:aldehyde dehydrogenase (NAD+)
MKKEKVYKNYIDGKWVDANSGKTFKNINPADRNDCIGIFPYSDKSDVEMAINAARKAYPLWRSVPVPKRGEILLKAAQILVERKEELARTMTREMGKILKEARGDVQEAIDTGFYMASEGRRLFGHTTPSELPNKFCLTMRMPIGVCGLITPWNFPIAIPSWKIFPALLCGNTVVFKPASDTPASAVNFVEILIEAGVPKGVINLVHGTGENVGIPIVEHDDVDVISFTGSSEVGSKIYEIAGKKLKKVSLELGGKNAQIVMDDANLDLAVEGALWGAFGTTGQRCTATSRIILHKKIANEFIRMFLRGTEKIKIGNGLDETVEMGPVINKSQLEKIDNYVKIGIKEGAKLLTGGKILDYGKYKNGWFYAPTIFTNVEPKMRIAQEEIFGPVVVILIAKDFDEAIKIHNDCKYGLSSSIYTQDVNRACKAIRDLEAGITYINGPTIGAETHLPFGGIKNTGNGHREGGMTALEIFSEWKTIYIDYSGRLQRAQIDNR